MAKFRLEAIKNALAHKTVAIPAAPTKVSEYFACNVFNEEAMREFLPEESFKNINDTIFKGAAVSSKMADQVASSMKAWAISKGATHYTHWFQPLNGATAEKHDAFFCPIENARSFEKFDGTQLIQAEPDASSFPSGGIRNTFEARGYTAWDPSSSAFIIDGTLCIPTIFISYTGEALDFKTPLLKSCTAIDKIAVEICQYFDKNVTKVFPTLGWEQEYFLVDDSLFSARPDLILTGRTLLGHNAARGQQMDDHYFGAIPQRVMAFMKEFEIESWKLGIPVKTRHNEVAPNQFELAPVYEEVNLANDHNQLVMVIMERIARKHNFRILYHEKPFAGINGSGKHNNWSLQTNTGKNLLSPGKTPKNNLLFLTFFVNIVRSIREHADLLRAAIASAGNEHRLGANEAPPAIISAFIGTEMSKVFDDIVKKVKEGKMSPDLKTELKLNIGKIPQIIRDNTDRNRTSPFAFTGNKFELRAVGASANCAPSMIVLNTILAEQLNEFKVEVDKIISKGLDKDEAFFQVIRKYIIESKDILFEGNGYGEEWVIEAKKRGLSNIKTTPEALNAYTLPKTINLFKKHNVFTERELIARYDIRLENYAKIIQLESRVIGDLAINHIIPTAIQYQNILLQNVESIKAVFTDKEIKELTATPIDTIRKISSHISAIKNEVDSMIEERRKANKIEDVFKHSEAYCHKVRPYLEKVREHADELEIIIDDELWSLPKYRELLFIR